MKFLVVCLNPTLQKTLILPRFIEGEVNRAISQRTDCSGKGINVCRVLKQLGEKEVVHLTQGSSDFSPESQLFFSLCKEENINVLNIPLNSGIRLCYTVLNNENHSTTEIVEEGQQVQKEATEAILNAFRLLVKNCDTVFITGSKAKGFNDSIFSEMVQIAKQVGKLVVLDYRGKDLLESLKYSPDFIKPNLSEFVETFLPNYHKSLKENEETTQELEENVKTIMLEIFQQHGTRCILTHGKFNTFFIDENGIFQSVKPILIETKFIVNTIGCGDAFAAGFLSSISQSNRTIMESVLKGHICASQKAQTSKPGSIL